MSEQALPLHIQIASDAFGWEWQADWQAWCPPGWPSRSSLGGSLDDRGRPLIPDYQYDTEAAEILWQCLHAQPRIQSIRFMLLPIPADSLRGVRPWRCEIVAEFDRVVTGEGDDHREALCYAVLALATARHHSTA